VTPSEHASVVLEVLKGKPTLLYELKGQLKGVRVLAEWKQNSFHWWIRFEGEIGIGHVDRRDGVYAGRADSVRVGEFPTLGEAAAAVDASLREQGYLLAGDEGLEDG
jgi:hypothetical protein